MLPRQYNLHFKDHESKLFCDCSILGKQFAVKMINANEELLKSVMIFIENTSDGPWDMKHVAETLGFFCSCGKFDIRWVCILHGEML